MNFNNPKIEEFFTVADSLAIRKDIVQGGGGNLSIKISEKEMLIKASGFSFSELRNKNGFVLMDYKKARLFFESAHSESVEDEYDLHVKNCIIGETDKKPSIEAGMHVFLGTAVLHTHPVMTNVLTCMKGGKRIAEKIFSNLKPNLLWIDYVNPGYSLANAVKKEVENYTRINGIAPEIIFLKNHGLIVVSKDLENCLRVTIEINNEIENYLKNRIGEQITFPRLRLVNENGRYASRNEIITQYIQKYGKSKIRFLVPDDAVFISEVSLTDGANYSENEIKSTKIDEVLTARLYLQLIIEKIGKPEYLKKNDIEYIQNMNSEKYRKKI